MNAVSPVLLKPVFDLPEVDVAAGTDYLPLPVLLGSTAAGMTTARFKLTLRERLTLLFHGNLWLQQMTMRQGYPPCKLMVHEPPVEECL
jgi:hypothetical protein